eukprot:TRINITY_DN1086_c0_g1_i1.p1 TRINITY_DN1086_c0_g1~~TRINITY_DN1086_c0_g1_i1.p1  ORF type:complete len:119 (+),score=4.59 TRINITY_DN1086_c0_g1_i1:191-547(+)
MGCAPSGPKEVPKCKLLLQGTAGCGKTTFSKQMKIIHGQEFSQDERNYFKSTLSVNVILGLKDLAEYVRENSKDHDEEVRFVFCSYQFLGAATAGGASAPTLLVPCRATPTVSRISAH